jgi:hypothetical protein
VKVTPELIEALIKLDEVDSKLMSCWARELAEQLDREFSYSGHRMTKDEFLRLATTAIADALVSDRATSGPDMTMADVGVAAMAFQDCLAQQPKGTFPMSRRAGDTPQEP